MMAEASGVIKKGWCAGCNPPSVIVAFGYSASFI
jgi:hypothetical protein